MTDQKRPTEFRIPLDVVARPDKPVKQAESKKGGKG